MCQCNFGLLSALILVERAVARDGDLGSIPRGWARRGHARRVGTAGERQRDCAHGLIGPLGHSALLTVKMTPLHPSSRSSSTSAAAQSTAATFQRRIHTLNPLRRLLAFIATAAGIFHTPHRAHLLPARRPHEIHHSHISGCASHLLNFSTAPFLFRSHAFTLSPPFAFFCWAEADLFLGFLFERPPPSSLTAHSSPRSTIASRRFTARCNVFSSSLIDSILSVVQGK